MNKNVLRRIACFMLAFILTSGSVLTTYGVTVTRKVTEVGDDDGPGGDAAISGSQMLEMRGVWISYLDWEKWSSQEATFKAEVDKALNRCMNLGMNAVFVHVRPDADAMYPSAYFPWSKFVTGTQGNSPGYDPLAYFVEAAHSRGLEFHAWVNPYRVTGYLNRWDDVADTNPAKMWLNDSDSSNDRWVLRHNNEYYFNPAIPQVRDLIINGVKEIVSNYNVDGIHFDDYFYPEINNNNEALWFDKPEYDVLGSRNNITAWRRNNVNELIRGTYAAIKAIKPNVQFGVSPEGYVTHLRSADRLFVDIDTWMSKGGYVDYIMPQIYWGFETKLPNRTPAPYAFSQNLKTWINLKNKGKVRLYLGLAMYKAGTNTKDYNSVSEWTRKDDIIARQVEEARRSGEVSGYCFYSYSSFQSTDAQKEVENLMKVLK